MQSDSYESVSISTPNLAFSAAHSDSNIRILFRLKFGTQGLRPSWGAISTFFWDRISITSIWLFLNNSKSTTEEKLVGFFFFLVQNVTIMCLQKWYGVGWGPTLSTPGNLAGDSPLSGPEYVHYFLKYIFKKKTL